MMLFTTLRANQQMQRVRAAVTRLGYETGYYGLPEQGREYIEPHVRLVAQQFYFPRVAPTTLQTEVDRLEASLAQATIAANATRAQADLQPALVPILKWTRAASVCAATYLVGEMLQFTMRDMTAREWLTLCVVSGLATAPWVLGLPIVAGCRTRLAAWKAASKVSRLRRRVAKKRAKLERAVAQTACAERWIAHHVAALQQDYMVALQPAKKAREQMAQLDSFAPPTMEAAKHATTDQDNPTQPLNGAAKPMTFHEEPALA